MCEYYLDSSRIVQDKWINKDWITNHLGSLDKDSSNVGTGLVGAPECGDVMKLQIEVKDNKTDYRIEILLAISKIEVIVE